MVDLAGLALAGDVDGLDAVAVGIEQEGAVVLGRVLRPRAGLAVAGEAGFDAGAVEGVDELVRGA